VHLSSLQATANAEKDEFVPLYARKACEGVETFHFLNSAVGRMSDDFSAPIALFWVKHLLVRIEQDSEPVWKF
jgi:hypothetical protein